MVKDVIFGLEISKLVLALGVMGYAAYSDLKTREIEPKLWLTGIIGAALTLIELYLVSGLSVALFKLLLLELVFSLIIFPFLYVSYKMAMLGGADMLAYLFLSLTVPWYPLFLGLRAITPVPILTLLHATILAILIALVRLISNLLNPEFRKFLKENKIGLLGTLHYGLSGKVMKAKEYLRTDFWYLIHEIENGIVKKELRKRVSIDEEPEDHRKAVKNSIEKGIIREDQYLMVTYATPFLVYMTLGFLATLVIGDYWVRALFE
ncbi:hypothetical protein EYM_05410 [Ignicoccus islandicus DSM 13165]|uniref:Uncharacterized protein n=1 Tax=Ignicoccus islandicus DSM 13165 TaxID=940295 RepID=A0A0U3FL74_9CREN|nr:A24 family peptidase C-terminal domain-containing protein [Ignicoccus islandicus]ALU12582.1 hypothetical protein EYM_05410 [Ignicoccus islandicus DSM 13165]